MFYRSLTFTIYADKNNTIITARVKFDTSSHTLLRLKFKKKKIVQRNYGSGSVQVSR